MDHSEKITWLLRLLRKVPTTHPQHAILSTPHVVIIDGSPWTVATNGHAALYLKGATPDVKVASEEVTAILAKHFKPEPREYLAVVGLDVLKAWCEPPQWTEVCPACKGTSAGNEYVTCTFCDDDGSLKVPERYGYLCGAFVGRELLAEYLYGDSGGEVAIHWTNKVGSPLWVATQVWRVAAMTVLPGSWATGAELAAMPRFPA